MSPRRRCPECHTQNATDAETCAECGREFLWRRSFGRKGYNRVTVYERAPGVRCVPLNDLPREERPRSGYVIVGAGKTGMDACLWLLENGVDPATLTWIMPRDSWLLDRSSRPRSMVCGRARDTWG